ncbi:hypothetical protein HPB47_024896 [Ixodes persulcatus]|uniref:Uncharacterized protein n=1 Tax=Ixodes persulcatus TaxID=34615 RepID=A0AC60Q510_IXOPE|nr:hypothetical protein HPB47_024896 [Ixodes persulcatus]
MPTANCCRHYDEGHVGEIKSPLHFNDNLSVPPADSSQKNRLFKIRPLLELLLPKFECPRECLPVDEQAHFNAHSHNAPRFVTYNGGRFSDVTRLLEHVSKPVYTLILHVGTNDVARNNAVTSLDRLHQLLVDVRSARRETECIYISLVLPWSVNCHLR